MIIFPEYKLKDNFGKQNFLLQNSEYFIGKGPVSVLFVDISQQGTEEIVGLYINWFS
jgi:hypothetical protein